jgi:His/Glu/Gln/Arg/opine family amino acid ABC transporter permease subunit
MDVLAAIGFGSSGYGWLFVKGMAVTVSMAVAASLCALLLGAALGAAACSRYRVLRVGWRIYRSIFASMPTLLVLFFFYLGAPYLAAQNLGVDIEIGPFEAGLCGLSLIYASYVAEVIRGAVYSVPRGQYEACQALGLSARPTWIRVIVPQVVRIALPGLINNWVVLLKDTALVSVIGVADVVRIGQIAGSATGRPLTYLAIVGVFFVIVVTLSLALLHHAGKRKAGVAEIVR